MSENINFFVITWIKIRTKIDDCTYLEMLAIAEAERTRGGSQYAIDFHFFSLFIL